jgi:hypothetical protein
MTRLYAYMFLYKEFSKPLVVITPIFFVNIAGCVNACDDIKHNRKKPIYVNLFEIGKYATIGAIFGATAPISMPISYGWLLYNGTYK